MNPLCIVIDLFLVQVLHYASVNSLGIVPLLKPNFLQLRRPRDIRAFQSLSLLSEKTLLPPAVYRCGESSKDLVLNFVNSNFPDMDASAGDCRFRLVISNPNICQVRVDFVDTEMVAPTRGDCLTQQFEVDGATWPTGLPPLCGINNDQHFYLHLEPWSANRSYLDFKLVTAVSGKPYRFGMWLTQIDCTNFNILRAPDGCTQYFLAEHGSIKTFNFEGKQYLNGQNYRICIRPGKGVCGVRYNSSESEFHVRKSILAAEQVHMQSGTGSSVCGLDYVLIPNGQSSLSGKKGARSGRLFWRRPRPSPGHIIVVPYQSAPPATRRAPATVAPTTTTAPVLRSILKIPTAPSISSTLLKGYSDRYCGGILSTVGEETTARPIFATVTSNLITLSVRTSTESERKALKRDQFPNLPTGFRLHYTQIRECENHLADVAAQTNILHPIQSANLANLTKNSFLPGSNLKAPSGLMNLSPSYNSTSSSINSDDILWDYLGQSLESNEVEPLKDDDYALYDF